MMTFNNILPNVPKTMGMLARHPQLPSMITALMSLQTSAKIQQLQGQMNRQ
jgi:hypothetical protein